MISANIFGFVLVLVAAECVALVWIIFSLRQATREQGSWTSTYATVIKNLRQRLDNVEKEAPTTLALEVVELRDAVARLRLTHQRFAGRFDQYVKQDSMPDKAPPPLDRDALRREHANTIMPAGVKR